MAELDTSWGRLLNRPRGQVVAQSSAPLPDKQSVLIRLPGERARVDIHGQRALVFPLSTTPLSVNLVKQSVRVLDDLGFQGWIETIALADQEVHGFRSAGFQVRQSLCLLTRDLRGTPRRSKHANQTGMTLSPVSGVRNPDIITKILRVDACAFGQETSLDLMGFQHSLTATKQVRVCGAWHGDELQGFAISGRVGRGAYLQRLAVTPAGQGQGTGSLLCHDALSWAKRQRAHRMVVNTHYENYRALDLYARLGFERASTGLTVMGYHRSISTTP